MIATDKDDRLRRNEWYVIPVSQAVAEAIVEQYHYARAASSIIVYRHGLFRHDSARCWGVALWIPPTRSCAEASYDGDWQRVLTLHRLVCVPEAPRNAASFLIGQSIKIIRRDAIWECLLTYADPIEGHTGAIYRATNWEYIGLSDVETRWVDKNGRIVARKCGTHTRTNGEMLELGYTPVAASAKHKYRMILGPAKKKQMELPLC